MLLAARLVNTLGNAFLSFVSTLGVAILVYFSQGFVLKILEIINKSLTSELSIHYVIEKRFATICQTQSSHRHLVTGYQRNFSVNLRALNGLWTKSSLSKLRRGCKSYFAIITKAFVIVNCELMENVIKARGKQNKMENRRQNENFL